MAYLNAILLAVVEGVTEFLPVSSTGHLILLEQWLPLGGDPEFEKAFMVIIQLPAILAVVLYFWPRLWPFHAKADAAAVVMLWLKVAAAFFPAAVLGFLLDDFIEERLFNPLTVASALIAGGVVLYALERLKLRVRFGDAASFGFKTAIIIGFFQCLAMIPGTSRSAATIIGAMALGAGRAAAAEFSFFLAIPTMLGATTLKILKGGLGFSGREWALLAVGSVVSFAVAYAVIALFMGYIRNRSFVPFAWYRVALGLLVLLFSLT